MQIVGEAGVGKTTLARSLIEVATSSGTSVTWGRCIDDTGAPPYYPWIQVLRAAMRAGDAERLVRDRPYAARWLAQLDPSLAPVLGAGGAGFPVPSGLDAAQARFALFEAVAGVLASHAEVVPALVVLDDVHSADAASVLLLGFVARALSDERLLLVTTARRALDELADDSELVALGGLSESEVAEFFEMRTGVAPTPDGAGALHRATGGNPLFLEQVVGSDSVSTSVALMDMLRRRLTRMPAAVVAALTAFAVLEEGLPAAVVREVSGLQPASFVEATDMAVAAGLLFDPGHGGPYRFSHPLLREALATALEPTQLRKLHLLAAEALERLDLVTEVGRGDVSRAHHRRKALPLGDPIVAVEATLQAAAQAVQAMAFEDAVTTLTACLDALDRLPVEMAAERCRLLVALAQAHEGGGQRDEARKAAREAAAVARRLGSPGLLAAAVLGMPRGPHILQPDPELRELIQEALESLGTDDSPERVRLLARLAQEFPTDSPDDLRRVADEAAAIAVRLHAPVLRALAHKARQQALWGAVGAHDERLASASEMVALAREQGNIELELDGHMWRMIALLESGRIGEAELEMGVYRRLAEETRHPWFLMFARSRQAMFALLHGRFDEGEHLAREARDLATTCGSREGDAMFELALGELHFERRHDDALGKQVDRAQRIGMPFVVAMGLAQLGRLDEARAALRAGVEHSLGGPRAFHWLAVLAAGARAAWALRDQNAAGQLYDAIASHGPGHVVIGGGVAYQGPKSRYLGLCAAASGRATVAVSHLQSALCACESAAALPLVARTSLELAQVLVSQGSGDDSGHARELAAKALALGRSIGMDRLVDETQELVSRLSTPAHPAASLRRRGDYWELDAGGMTVTLKHSQGLEQLARLLAAPNQDISALDLLIGTGSIAPASVTPVLDHKAKDNYRRRLRELDDELKAAALAGDARREEAADAERAALLRSLRRAVGIGGRDRPLGSDAERARVNVTRTLRHAVDQIVAVAPDLGGHLLRSVRTGGCCSYRPPPGEEQNWSL